MRMIYFYAYLCKLLQFDTMKARLNITIDAPLLAEVKKVAFKQKTSVSEIVEKPFETTDKALAYKLVEKGYKLKEVVSPAGARLLKLYIFIDTETKIREVLNG